MVNLLWRDYIKAIESGDAMSYYSTIYGSEEIALVVVDYWMNQYKPLGLDGMFNLVESINTMPFGQFIAGETALTSGFDKHKALEILSLTVLRPIEDVEFDNTDRVKEARHVEDVMNTQAAEVLNEIEKYVGIRDTFVNNTYAGVFYQIQNEVVEEEEDKSEYTADDTMEEQFSKQWYWYAIIRTLANEVMWDYERVMMTPMNIVAPELAYKRHRQIVEEIREKRRNILNKY